MPVLALIIAMSEAGAAHDRVISASVTPPPPAIAVSLAEAGRQQNTALALRVALPLGLTDASEVRSLLPGAEIGPAPPESVAKTSALVLSSLGMLGVIALLRLNRTL